MCFKKLVAESDREILMLLQECLSVGAQVQEIEE